MKCPIIFRFLSLLALFPLTVPPAFSQPGSNDSTFNPSDIGFGNGDGADPSIFTTSLQADGKIIIGGSFTAYNGTARNRIARLNADGSLDITFNPGTGAMPPPPQNIDEPFSPSIIIYSTAIQSDGKIIIGGDFFRYNGSPVNRIARLNTDGTLDISFNSGANGTIYTIAIQADGKIIIGGNFTSYNGTARNRIARLNADGSLDGTFNPGTGANDWIYTAVIQSDGKIVIAGFVTSYNGTSINRIARLNADGTLDPTFNQGTGANNIIRATAIQSDGKIIIGGRFTSYNNTVRDRIARLNTDGTLDGTFNPGTGADREIVNTTAIQSDGKIIIGGDFFSYDGNARKRIARLNTDGTLDATFDPSTGANNAILTITIQPGGKIIIGGTFNVYNDMIKNYIARLNADGTLDGTFNRNTGANNTVFTTAIQSDSRIIIGGLLTLYNGIARNSIARVNASGMVDSTFNPGTGANNTIRTTTIQSDGKIIIGGDFTLYNGTNINRIARLNADGNLDGTFNTGTGVISRINTTAIQSDGKIIIGGDFPSYNGIATNKIARLNADGTLDGTFNQGSGAENAVFSISIQNGGKIVIGGVFTSYNGTPINRIARLNADGTLDGTFNPGTGVNSRIWTTAIQSDGKIIIGGEFSLVNGTVRNRVARLNADGTLDATFNPGTGANSIIRTTAIQSDGKIIIGGDFTSYNGTPANYIARLNTDGTLDQTFNTGTGANNAIYTTCIQNDGRIIIGGLFTSYNGTGRNRIARIIGGETQHSLPVNFVNIKAYKNTLGIQVEWTTLTEINTDQFVVEKSVDGRIFTSLGTVAATGNSSNRVNYQFLDGATLTGSNYYRIKSIDKDGTAQYSKVVRVNSSKAAGAITVIPNPLTGNTINLQFTNFEKGKYTAILSNNLGQPLYSSVIDHPGGSSTQTLKINSHLPVGNYQLKITGAEMKTVRQLIIR